MDIIQRLPVWAASVVCTLMMGCVQEEFEMGFVPSDGYFSAFQNCMTLESVSSPICGEDTYGIHCLWGAWFGDYSSGAGLTAVPAETCDVGIEAAQRQATEGGIKCEVITDILVYQTQCDSADTADPESCAPVFVCNRL